MGSLTKKADTRAIFEHRAAMANRSIARLGRATSKPRITPLPRATKTASEIFDDNAKRQTNPRKKAQRKKMLRRDI